MKYFKHNEGGQSPIGLYYNAWFRKSTDCTELDKQYKKALVHMPIILSSSELSVYKICHHFHNRFNLSGSDIKTVDGLAIESYFDVFANHKYNIIQMEKLFRDGVLKDVYGKWLVIPNMSSRWSPKLAYLFYNELRNAGVIGLIFFSDGPDNFGKVLVERTRLNVFQFPDVLYEEKSVLPDDGK